MFLGRGWELQKLEGLLAKKTASLAVIRGRRRIGKSTLVQQFGRKFTHFYEFQGLAPSSSAPRRKQLENFSQQLSKVFHSPALELKNWTEAFSHLASLSRKDRTLILLDEVSWMGSGDPEFAGKLKVAWDTEFKNNDKLILVLCGSVSAWIEENILKDADFVGRISLEMNLKELPLNDCAMFWGKRSKNVSSMEKLKVLSVTGGVPQYLEEIDTSASAESNIKRLCFEDGGMLLLEFDKIFNEIFTRRSPKYSDVVGQLVGGNRSMEEISRNLKIPNNSDLNRTMHELEISGFIKRQYVFNPGGKKSRLSKFRLSDNYLRFYLKYVDPHKEKIRDGLYRLKSLETLPNWTSIMGLQFENLILNNMNRIVECMNLDFNSIVSASPYFQNKTKAHSACQIDLLLETRHNTLYLCEIKFRKKIEASVIGEIKEKIKRLKRPKYYSIRPVLIYCGELNESTFGESEFFDHIISLKSLMETESSSPQ